MLGDAIVNRQKHTIKPCECGSDSCTGWQMDAGQDDELVGYTPPQAQAPAS